MKPPLNTIHQMSESESPVCTKCNRFVKPQPSIQVKKTCDECGKDIFIQPGAAGLAVEKGDQIVVGAGFLQLSLDPKKLRGQMGKSGLSFLAKSLYFQGLTKSSECVPEVLKAYEEEAEDILSKSSLLKGLDFAKDSDAEEILRRLAAQPESVEMCSFIICTMVDRYKECQAKVDPIGAAHCCLLIGAARSLRLFRQQMEAPIWTAHLLHSAERLHHLLTVSMSNGSEEFWQDLLQKNSDLISLLFAFPAIVIQGKVYVGGKTLSNTGGKIVDFLLKNEITSSAVLLEIKTPLTRLTGNLYRGHSAPSAELSGAVIQSLSYRNSLLKEFSTLCPKEMELEHVGIRCLILVGNIKKEAGNDREAIRSFETYRNSLRDLEIVTYDELATKLRNLLVFLGDSL